MKENKNVLSPIERRYQWRMMRIGRMLAGQDTEMIARVARCRAVFEARKRGNTYRVIGESLGISRGRARQLCEYYERTMRETAEYKAQGDMEETKELTPLGQRIVYLSARFFAAICQDKSEHHFRVKSGLPADARPIRIFPKSPTGLIGEEMVMAIVFESAEWESLTEGAIIPDLMIEFEAIDHR